MSSCSLCDLPTPDQPITDPTVDGSFCCRGCLSVAQHLGDEVGFDPETDSLDSLDDLDAGAAEVPIPDDASTTYLSMEGLHCSACEVFLESLARDADGVYDANVSYATDSAKVTYDADAVEEASLPGLFSRFGYSARFPDDETGDTGTRAATNRRILAGSVLGMFVMVLYGLVLYPSYLELTSMQTLAVLTVTLALGMVYCGVAFLLQYDIIRAGILLALLNTVVFVAIMGADLLSVPFALPAVAAFATIVVFYTGYPFHRGAYVSLRAGRPNMDLLVSLAVLAAYVYSVVTVLTGGTEVYFDIAVMVVLVVTLGNSIETRVKRRAATDLAAFEEARITHANRRTPDGDVETVPLDALDAGDTILVKAGERIPVDGTVETGTAAVDESLVTGESLPDTKSPGDAVTGGTIVMDDRLLVTVGEDATSTLDRLVELLWDIQSSRTGVQQFADRLASVFVPTVLVLAAATAAYYLWTGAAIETAVLTGVAVLVVSCPCALGLATPLAISAGLRDTLGRGIVVTDVSVFERVKDVDTIVFDKTGTLTTGDLAVASVHSATITDGGSDADARDSASVTTTKVDSVADDDRILDVAATLEQFSTHPVAAAITDAGDPVSGDVADFESHPRGVSGTVDGAAVVVGHPDLFEGNEWRIPEAIESVLREQSETYHLPVVVGWDGVVQGVIVVADAPRPEWREVVDALSTTAEIVVLTGDDESATREFREHPGIDQVFAEVPPEGKASTVRRLTQRGTVAMVGDGSNDAPALAAADLGISLVSGTDLAADAADAIVTTNDLTALPDLFDVADGTRRRIWQNLGWAFTYNLVAIPLAMTAILNPFFAAIAMAGSSLVVVANSTRRIS